MQAITELAGRYRPDEFIAAGGMGEIWRGWDRVLARPVAIKLLHPAYAADEVTLARFRAEARHAGRLRHPGIAQIYDYAEATAESPAFLIMELVEGRSLAAILESGPLDPARTADVLAQTAAALDAAHTAGVLHRDIKPGNLLIAPDGQVKVTDFGIAQSPWSDQLTSTGALLGTMGYLAPERVSGHSATPASDLYALGIVGYECLAGHRPFLGESLQVALAHRDQPLPPLPTARLGGRPGRGLAALIGELTAKDPADRPRSAADVAGRAARLRGPGRPGPAATQPGPVLPRPPARRGAAAAATGGRPGYPRPSRLLTAACGGLLLVLAGLASVLVLNHGGPGAAAGPSASRSGTPPHTQTVHVSPGLAGRPVAAVRRELRGQGFQVQVRRRLDAHVRPGTVLAVSPTGELLPGTVVVLTAASQPSPVRATPAGISPNPAPTGAAAASPPAAGPPGDPAGDTPPGRAKHGKGPPPGHPGAKP
jgi:hypothetical protein